MDFIVIVVEEKKNKVKKGQVYYNPEYNGLHQVKEVNGKLTTIGGCCEYYNDAKTTMLRDIVKTKFIKKHWVLIKEKDLPHYSMISKNNDMNSYKVNEKLTVKNFEQYRWYKDKHIIKSLV